MGLLDILVYILVIFLLISVGWLGNDIYKEYTNKKILNGIQIRNTNWNEAIKTSYKLDSLGDWVCINIKGMSYKKAVETCQHETAHELFAEICEKDTKLCNQVQEDLDANN